MLPNGSALGVIRGNVGQLENGGGPAPAPAAAPAAAPTGSYTQVAKAGGYNYFLNGKPITVQQYNAGTGSNISPSATPPVQTVSGPANSNGATASAPAFADKSGDIALQTAGLGSVDTQTAAGLAAIDKALGGITGQYDTEAAANDKNYHAQSDTNQNNLQTNKETALVNAAQGRRGLFGTLSSLGALSGSGIDLANHAVQTGANQDLAGAGNNFATNQTGLDNSIAAFKAADDQRRQAAATAASDAKTAAQNEAAKSKQTYYANLANDYTAEGDTGNASKFSGMAASMYPAIAGSSVPSTNLAYSGAAYTPASLASYLTGANSTQVSTTPSPGGATLPGLIAAPIKKQVA